MSAAIDNFTQNLHDSLEAIEDRAKVLKKSIRSAPKKTQAEIQAKLDEAKANLDANIYSVCWQKVGSQIQPS